MKTPFGASALSSVTVQPVLAGGIAGPVMKAAAAAASSVPAGPDVPVALMLPIAAAASGGFGGRRRLEPWPTHQAAEPERPT